MKLNPNAVKKVQVKLGKSKQIEVKEFLFVGKEFLPDDYRETIAKLAEKFGSRHGVKLQYLPKFAAFKLFKTINGKPKHVDWIALNELMKIYDCRLPALKPTVNAQRPFKNDRVY
jgi:hypothetical protein